MSTYSKVPDESGWLLLGRLRNIAIVQAQAQVTLPGRASNGGYPKASPFHVYLPWGQRPFSICLNSVLNVKALEAFNQEKALVRDFSVI